MPKNQKITLKLLKDLLLKFDDGVLKHGGHEQGRDFCAMEFVAKVAGEPWTDNPDCVHKALSSICRSVNDYSWPNDKTRTEYMLPLLKEVFGTKDLKISLENIGKDVEKQIISKAIKAALKVYQEPKFVEWANNWLSGKDRSQEAAWAAYMAAEAAEAARAAWAAYWAAAWAAAEAAKAAGVAARAVPEKKLEIYKTFIDIVIKEIKRAKKESK